MRSLRFWRALLYKYQGALPPLTRDQLRAIYETNPTPAVRRLLWEIHRLRGVALRANDFVRTVDRYQGESRLDPGSGLAFKGLREALQGEPVVLEDEARRLTR